MSAAEAIRPNSTTEKLVHLDGGYGTGEQPRPTLDSVIEETQRRQADLKYQIDLLKFNKELAQMFAASGMFKSSAQANLEQIVMQAMVRIELGKDMGFSPAESMMGIDVIANRPAVQSALRAAKMQAAGYGWQIQWHKTGGDCSGVTLWLTYKGSALMEPKRKEDGTPIIEDGRPVVEQAHVSFKKSDAERIKSKLWEGQNSRQVTLLEKWNHSSSSTLEDMYFARAITRAQKRYAPAVMSTSILSVEEAMDLDTEPVQYAAAPDKPAEPGKGTASVKEALGIKKGEVMPSVATGTPKSPEAATPATARHGEGVEQARAPEWANLDEMQHDFVQLRRDMVEQLGPPGATDYDSVVRNAGGYPKDLQSGAVLYAKLRDSAKALHEFLK